MKNNTTNQISIQALLPPIISGARVRLRKANSKLVEILPIIPKSHLLTKTLVNPKHTQVNLIRLNHQQ